MEIDVHYYQFNIGDYASHTSHLTEIEDLAYRRMLDWCYLHEKPLPDDIEEIARLIRMHSHCDSIANVLREFFKHDDGYYSERVLEEIKHVNSKSEKAKASANARWSNKIKDLPSDANAMRTHSDCNATHNPIHKTQDPLHIKNPPTPQGADNGFEEFWQAYPKKVGKTAAQKAWSKLKSHKNSLELIKDALKWQRVSDQWTKENGQFIPNPATYLNQGRWLDTPIEPAGIPKLTKYGLRAQAAAERWLASHRDEGVANEG